MAASREVQESPYIQGTNEKIAYALTTTLLGSSPTNLVVTVFDISDSDNESDVTVAVTTGTANAAGDVVTTPYIQLLTAGKKYRLQVRFTDSNSNTWEEYAIINCQ